VTYRAALIASAVSLVLGAILGSALRRWGEAERELHGHKDPSVDYGLALLRQLEAIDESVPGQLARARLR
jgi:hypothetical protein